MRVTAFAVDNNELNDILSTAFSNISHKTGLQKADKRFEHVFKNVHINKVFSKSSFSIESNEFVNEAVSRFNVDNDMTNSTFEIAGRYVDDAGNMHITLSQRIKNVRVELGKVVIHFNKVGQLYRISGEIQDEHLITTEPQITGEEAIQQAIRSIEHGADLKGSSELSIIGNRLTYKMQLIEKNIPGYWTVFVDAKTGEVLEKQSSIRFLNPPGWPSNGTAASITGNICTHEGGGVVTVDGWQDYSLSPNAYYLFDNNNHWQVADFTTGSFFTATTSSWGTTNRPAMNLAHNFELIQKFVLDSMKWNSFNNVGGMAVAWYPDNAWGNVNAFWNGSDFHFGEGDGGVFGFEWVTLDGVAHEFGHAMTQYSSKLDNIGEPGALGESYSDILSVCIEAAYQPDGRDNYLSIVNSAQTTYDWLICEDIFVNGGNRWWLRNMKDPNIGGYQPNSPKLYMGEYWDPAGEVHKNSTVPSFAFYLISEGVGEESVNDQLFKHLYGPFRGLGISQARKVAWGAQLHGDLGKFSTFRDARNEWIITAEELNIDAGVVAQAWAAVGVIDRTVGKPAGVNLPSNPPDYATIAAAISSSVEGDLIYVYPGTYNENITISMNKISLVGRNKALTTINGNVIITNTADGVTVAGFTIDADANQTGITLLGTAADQLKDVTISANSVKNCLTAISLEFAWSNVIINNHLQGGNSGCLYHISGSDNFYSENSLEGGGFLFNEAASGNTISFNRWNKITVDGLQFTSNNSSNVHITHNEFMAIDATDIICYYSVQNLTCNGNVFSNSNGLALTLPSVGNASFAGNTFSANGYTITLPALSFFNFNFWENYTGQDTDGDGDGDTELPHEGLDQVPIMIPPVRALHIKQNDDIVMASTVVQGKFRIKGTSGAGPVAGLQFGNNSSLTADGNLVSTQLLHNSEKWLNQESNLSGGLVFSDAKGIPQMHIGSGGIVRTRENMTIQF